MIAMQMTTVEQLADGFGKALKLAERLQTTITQLEAENKRLQKAVAELHSTMTAHRDRIDVLEADNSILRRGVRRGFWMWDGGESEPDKGFMGYVLLEPDRLRELLAQLCRLRTVLSALRAIQSFLQAGLYETKPRSARKALEEIRRRLTPFTTPSKE